MIYLYYFTQYSLPDGKGTLVSSWAQTSYEDPISGISGYAGVTFTPTPGIAHGEVKFDGEKASGSVKVTVAHDHPVALLFLPGYPSGTVFLRVLELEAPGGLATIIVRGRVRNCEFQESTSTADLTCMNGAEKLQRLGLSIIHGSTCQWPIYGPLVNNAGCGVDRTPFERHGVITAISADGMTFSTTLSEVANYFKAGLVQVGSQKRMCTASTTAGALNLFSALGGASVGAAVTAWKGCDGSGTSCKTFGNYAHFSGDEMPDPKNIFLEGAAA